MQTLHVPRYAESADATKNVADAHRAQATVSRFQVEFHEDEMNIPLRNASVNQYFTVPHIFRPESGNSAGMALESAGMALEWHWNHRNPPEWHRNGTGIHQNGTKLVF